MHFVLETRSFVGPVLFANRFVFVRFGVGTLLTRFAVCCLFRCGHSSCDSSKVSQDYAISIASNFAVSAWCYILLGLVLSVFLVGRPLPPPLEDFFDPS